MNRMEIEENAINTQQDTVTYKVSCHKMRSYQRWCASADVGGQKLALLQRAQRCPPTSANVQRR